MKITLTQLKIYLDDSSKKILEKDLKELFTKFPQVKEFYQSTTLKSFVEMLT